MSREGIQENKIKGERGIHSFTAYDWIFFPPIKKKSFLFSWVCEIP